LTGGFDSRLLSLLLLLSLELLASLEDFVSVVLPLLFALPDAVSGVESVVLVDGDSPDDLLASECDAFEPERLSLMYQPEPLKMTPAG